MAPSRLVSIAHAFAAAVGLCVAMALLGSLAPTRRALRIAPAVALRTE